MRHAVGILIVLAIGLLVWGVIATTGAGSFKRIVTMSGIYTVCKPDGYDAVCFMDADGKEGGVFCLPLSQVGGKCLK